MKLDALWKQEDMKKVFSTSLFSMLAYIFAVYTFWNYLTITQGATATIAWLFGTCAILVNSISIRQLVAKFI